MAKALAQITIYDVNDIISSPSAPTSPVKDQCWLDTSLTPPVMKVWNGSKWVIENDWHDDVNKVQQQVTTTTERLNTATSDISVLKGQIALKVEQNDIDKTVTTVKNELVTKIDGIEVGIRNLLIGTKNFSKGTVHVSILSEKLNGNAIIKTLPFTSNYADSYSMKTSIIPIAKQYTASFYAKADENDVSMNCYFYNPNTTTSSTNSQGYKSTQPDGHSPFKISNKWEKYWVTWSQSTTDTPKTIIIGRAFNNKPIYISAPILVEGNKTGDYVEAPEDIDKSIADVITTTDTKIVNAKAEIKAETDKINLSVTNLTTKTNTIETQLGDKATKSEVKTVSDKATSIEANLNAITQRVSSTESTMSSHTTQLGQVDGKINTAKNTAIKDARSIPDTRSDNQPPSWYFSNYPKQTITEFKLASILRVSSNSTYGALTTVIPWGDKSGGYPVQTFRSQGSPTYERKGASDSTWEEWKQVEDTDGSQAKADTAKINAIDTAKNYTNGQITTVNKTITDKVAEIKTTTDTISSRVSNVESTTTTINGKVTNQETRLSAAEKKITSDAIVQTVTSSKVYTDALTGKVSTDKIISCINQTAEQVKIDANKINLNGYVTMTNLGTPGQTIIDGRNIKTGFIEAIQLVAPHITGKTQMYLETGSLFSSDGFASMKDLYVKPDSTFSSDSIAWLNKDVHVGQRLFFDNGDDNPHIMSNFEKGKTLNLGGMGWGGFSTQLSCRTWGVQVHGEFRAFGAKNRVVDTKLGTTKLNAYETADCLFGDVGEGKTDKNGICYIFLDKVFQETIDKKHIYQVFISEYGDTQEQWAKCSERHSDYFIVKGSPNTSFTWELKAKQRDYEMERLEFTEKIDTRPDYTSSMYVPEEDNSLIKSTEEYLINYDREIELGGM